MKQILIYTIITAVLFSGCKKFTDVPAPADVVIAEDVFMNDAKAISALTSIYGNMINGPQAFCNYLATTCGGMSADELNKFNPTAAESEILSNQISPDNGLSRNVWNTAYKQVYYANAILEGVEKSNLLSVAVRQQLKGEALLIRSFSFFYLCQFFGDVPLTLTTDYAVNRTMLRNAKADVMAQAIKDLETATSLLGETYAGTERGRPNKFAALALLARCYLYQGDWEKAEAAATAVLSSGLYTPLPDLSNSFVKTSKEVIWQLVQRTGSIPEPKQLRPASSGRPLYYITPELRNSFSHGDQRKLKWIDSITYQNVKYFFAGKYKITGGTSNEYYVVFRASEQYLIRAEAKLMQQKVTEAINDLNVVRVRAGLSALGALTETEAKDAIYNERRHELFCEWGHRWLDLKRTGMADAVLAPLKPSWQSTDTLYPIPHDDMLANPFLTQNKGY